MPLVRQRILDLFGDERVVTEEVVEPMTAVAVGAAYPREFDHFCLLYPPYSVQLVLSDEPDGEDTVITLHQAYDKLEYYIRFPSNTLPIYRTPRQPVERTYRCVRLRFEGCGSQVNDIPVPFSGGLSNYYVTIDLAGRVQVNQDVVPGKELCRVPVSHPVQDEILRADEERGRRGKEQEIRKALDMKKTIYLEN